MEFKADILVKEALQKLNPHMKNKNAGQQSNSPGQVLHQYQKERHADYSARSIRLDELAFKTSERYDQWVLTLSGGALAVSLTFLEKIAPEPVPATLWFLALSWLSFIGAILAGFLPFIIAANPFIVR